MNEERSPEGEPPLETLFQENLEGLAGAVRSVLGYAADVQEVLQEAFLRAWKAMKAGTRPRDPRAFIFVVALNTARDMRRRAALRTAVPLEEIDPVKATYDTEPGARLEHLERVRAARAAIHRLSDKEREVFLMRVSGGLTFEAIAGELAIPVNTAKSRMRLALARLHQNLETLGAVPTAGREDV